MTTPTTRFEWALAYAARGLRVIPVWWPVTKAGLTGCSCAAGMACSRAGKHPIPADWPTVATTDEGQLREWFVTKYPAANIGLVMGQGNVAVDIDNPYALEELESRGLPIDTPTQNTGSGGFHRLYTWTGKRLKNAIRFIAGADIRSDGGFIVAEPSTNAHGAYHWDPDHHILDDVSIAPLPEWIADLCAADNPVQKPTIRIDDLWAGIPQGARNGKLFSYACKMRRDKRPELEIMAVLMTLASKCSPPLALSEVEAIVSSSGRYTDKRDDEGLVAVEAQEFLAMNIPPRATLLHPWIKERDVSMIYAWRGCGKTWVTLGLAAALTTGGEFLKWRADHPVGVLVVDGEMPSSTLQARLARVLLGLGRDLKAPLRFVCHDMQENGIPSLDTSRGQEYLERHLDEIGVILFDNISTLFRSGVENESEGWAAAQEWLLRLRRLGKTSLMQHHAGKNGVQRGTSKREDILDCVVQLKRPKDYERSEGARFEVRFEKARGIAGDDIEPFEATLFTDDTQGASWLIRDSATSHESQVADMVEAHYTQRQIAEELGISLGKANRLVRQLKERRSVES